MQENWQLSLKQQFTSEYVRNSTEWVDLNISTSGLLNLTIISDLFVSLSMPQRKEKISTLLQSRVPHLSPGFLSLYTLQEAESLNFSRPQVLNAASVNTWQDLAIQAANPHNQTQLPQPELRIPRTVTFYSFKGGVGRTTALTHVASILATRGLKVVAVDLDLEAPGLSTAFNLNPQPKYGIVDYFYERSYLPEGIKPRISIAEIFGEVRVPNATGRLFVVPAGCLNLDYISKVDDLHATTIIDGDKSLWSIFKGEIQEQLKPDILLIDSRTGINQWGALSLIQAADEAIIFLFPNEQNKQGIELVLQSLQSLKNISINFVFSPVPDITKTGLSKVKNIWDSLQKKINIAKNENYEAETDEDEDESDLDNDQTLIEDILVIPYLVPIALADSYPVPGMQDYYTKIANLIDEKTDELKRSNVLNIEIEQRWKIIESLQFPEVNAADQRQDLSLLFQRTTDFERFLDDETWLIRGRKGTGKTALYWLFLKHKNVAEKIAPGRLDNTKVLSAHGTFQASRPSRTEFQIIHQTLQQKGCPWEDLWRAYLLLRCYQENLLKFPRLAKYKELTKTIKNLPKERWQSENTEALLQLSTNSQLRLIVKDAVNILLNEQAKDNHQKLWFLYDDLDEDFPEAGEVRHQALTGLFQLVQSCNAERLTEVRFKIFLREDIWNRLIFDNKSHFTGRDIILQWTRIDFLRLAFRQATQSKEFKNLVDKFSPIESIDQASENAINKALEILWGSRRRRGGKAKYVSRWVYERLTDSSGTTFPRSLSILLEGAKEQELSYEGKSSIQPPTDRLLRSQSLESGLKKASEKRCEEIQEEYPSLAVFFDSLKGQSAILKKEQLQEIWQNSALDIREDFGAFVSFLGEIGIIEWREKEQRYKFADIYVYGFKMDRRGTL